MVERTSIFFHKNIKKTNKILAVRLEGVVLGREYNGMLLLSLDFGLGLWRLHTMAGQKAPIPIYYWGF
jgi:hypothetical protein